MTDQPTPAELLRRDGATADQAAAIPPDAQLQPIPLRWGLHDTLWGDDDTITVMLSGPDGEPYWLELDPERAAVLREHLAGPDPAASAVSLPPVDQSTLRDCPPDCPCHRVCIGERQSKPPAAVLPATTDQTVVRPSTLHAIARHLAERAVTILRPESQAYAEYNAVADLLRRMADETQPAETEAHVCKPGASVYYCPTSGETESSCHSGFDACCDRPDLHDPAAGARQDGAQQLPTPAETAPADESPHVYMDAVQDSAAWAHAFTKAGQTAEALEHVEAMERLLAVYRRAVGA